MIRFEIVILIITIGVMYNIYTEGRYIKILWTYKKYYKMAGVALAGLVLYYVFKKTSPKNQGELLHLSNEYLKYLPVDKQTTDLISPILNMSYAPAGARTATFGNDINAVGGGAPLSTSQKIKTGLMNQFQKTKRSVSESKKKFIAARQQWKCASCQELLPATYEIDHTTRLEYGGSNHVNNLQALCRNCHGQKTMTENMDGGNTTSTSML